jgi:SUN family beta-glucosidase
MKLSGLAILGTAATVSAHRHAHRHTHAGSPIEARAPDVTIVWVPSPTETIYELNGKILDADQVSKGVAAGIYILVPDSTQSTPTSTAAPSTSAVAAEFFQKSTTSSDPPAPTTTSAAPPSSTSDPPQSTTSQSSSGGSSYSSGGVDSEFPSGTIPCSTFPSSYGAVAADWLKFNLWTGIQLVPDYNPGDGAISNIATVPEKQGGNCQSRAFCSYQCPEGYLKSQWPAAQGNTGQSIGGLYCNSNGMLELSRPSVKQLCIKGTGQVKVQNTLNSQVAICRTDYPGTESETVGLSTGAGSTHDLACPDASSYYMHQGSFTSAQYYINPMGVSVGDGCQWQDASITGPWYGSPGNIGNWAPVNLGVGKGPAGTTFISLLPNDPTNPSGTLDFNIKITGDIVGQCEYKGGHYYNGGNLDDTGCTVSLVRGHNFTVFADDVKVGVTGTATYVLWR